MRAQLLTERKAAADRGGAAGAAPGPAAGADRGACLRRLPHRSACRRRRTARPETAARASATRSSAPSSKLGAEVDRFALGDRVGVPWLGWTCGVCEYCRSGRENLCDRARFTGYQIDGGYAELTVADQRYCFAIDPRYGDVEAAPLLCAGLIGYRTLRLAGDARAARHLRFWRRRAHRRAGDPPSGPPDLRLHPAGRSGGAGFRARRSAPNGPAISTRRRPSRSTRR